METQGIKNQPMRRKKNRILPGHLDCDGVVLVTSGGVEVEDEHHLRPLEHDDLILFMLGAHVRLRAANQRKETSLLSVFLMNNHPGPNCILMWLNYNTLERPDVSKWTGNKERRATLGVGAWVAD